MNLQQLRYINEVLRRNLKISDAADALYTSQPNVSKQIRLFEEELGVDIFIRNGKRLVGVTKPGEQILEIAQRILHDSANLKQISDEFRAVDSGQLVIATTHTQARYALPSVVKEFIKRYPKIRLCLHQGSPTQIAQQVLSGEADLGIATESLALYDELVTLPCYQWSHCVITPPDHPLLQANPLTLADLAAYPLITYDFAFSGSSKVHQAFEAAGLKPNVALTAIDSDVIKTYVELGLGVGILAQMAYQPERDSGLVMREAKHLFDSNTTKIALCKTSYLRGYAYQFIELFAPKLTRSVIDQQLNHA